MIPASSKTERARSTQPRKVVFEASYANALSSLLAVLALSGAGVASGQTRVEVYVAPNATLSKQADGSLEKPFPTIPEAVSAVRALRQSGRRETAVIYLREGRHVLQETLVLNRADGRPAPTKPVALDPYGAGEVALPAYLTLAAYPDEHPVVSAGVPVENWRRLTSSLPGLPASAAGKVWVADMPEGVRIFSTLYDSNGRLARPERGIRSHKNG